MGIGARSPLWRRALFWLFGSIYFRRKCKTVDGTFEAYVSPNSFLGVLDFRKSLVDQVHERFIRKWVKSDAVVWDVGGISDYLLCQRHSRPREDVCTHLN